MVPICTGLTEPKVQATVNSPLREEFPLTSTIDEMFHFGYICEGSAFVAKNITRNVSLILYVDIFSTQCNVTNLLLLYYFGHLKYAVKLIMQIRFT